MKPDRPLRLGMIGAGRWSRSYLKTVAAIPDCTIARVARRSDKPLDPPFNEIPVTADWRDVAQARDLDGVIIASPPSFHAEPAIAALRHGLPVLIEKPMTLTVADAQAIRTAAQEVGIPAMVEHTHLFTPAFRAIQEAVAGRTLEIESLAGNRGTFHADYSSLWDWGAHDVAMTLELAKSFPESIRARRVAHEDTPDGSGDLFELVLTFRAGTRAKLVFGNIMDTKTRRLLVNAGDVHWLYDDWVPPRLFHAPAGYSITDAPLPACAPVACDGSLPLGIAVQEFCERIRGKTPRDTDLELGVQVVEVLAVAEQQVGTFP